MGEINIAARVIIILHISTYCQAQFYDHFADHEDPHANHPEGQQRLSLYDGWSIEEIKVLCTESSTLPCPLDKLDQSTERGKYLHKIQSDTLEDAKSRIIRFEKSFGIEWRLWIKLGFLIPVIVMFFVLVLTEHWDIHTIFNPHPFDGSFGFDPDLYQRMKFKVVRIIDSDVTRMVGEEQAVSTIADSASSSDEEKFSKYSQAQQIYLRRKRLYKKAAARTRFINLERKRYQAENDLIKKENARTGFLNKSEDYKGRIATKFAARKGVDEKALLRSKLIEKYGELEPEEYEIASKFK